MELNFQNSLAENWFLHLQKLSPELKKHVYDPRFARSTWNSVHKHLFHLLDSVFFTPKEAPQMSLEAAFISKELARS